MPALRADLDRGVTIAAVDAELARVMAMTERHGLLARDAGLRDVGGPIDQLETVACSRDHEERPEDADPRNRVRAAVKYLRHARRIIPAGSDTARSTKVKFR